MSKFSFSSILYNIVQHDLFVAGHCPKLPSLTHHPFIVCYSCMLLFMESTVLEFLLWTCYLLVSKAPTVYCRLPCHNFLFLGIGILPFNHRLLGTTSKCHFILMMVKYWNLYSKLLMKFYDVKDDKYR